MIAIPIFLLLSTFSRTEGKALDRFEFAKLRANITDGMSYDAVQSILGPPDYRRKIHRDDDEEREPSEQWLYGTDSESRFPTLGEVNFDKYGQALHPELINPYPSKDLAPEAVTCRILRQIAKVLNNRRNSLEMEPLDELQAANAILRLGEKQGLAVLDEYFRITQFENEQSFPGLCLSRLLFEPANPPGFLPAPMPASLYPPPPDSQAEEPRYPWTIVQGIPFDLHTGRLYYMGPWPSRLAEYHYDDLKRRCTFRKTILAPTDRPWEALDELWRVRVTKSVPLINPERRYLEVQISRLLKNVYRPTASECHGMTWQGLEQKLAALKIHWDRIQDEYVFADGSHLDPKGQKVEENSAQWEFSMPDGQVGNVLVTRSEPDWVDVDISYSLTQGARIPEAEIEVVHSAGHYVLSHVISPSRSGPKTFVDRGWGFDVDLPSGEGIRIRLPINGKWLTSPILVP